jgi:hypothetical protein
MIKGTFINTITVTDPDSGLGVEVSIYKLETGGMIGVDESFLLRRTNEPVYSPFDLGEELDLD